MVKKYLFLSLLISFFFFFYIPARLFLHKICEHVFNVPLIFMFDAFRLDLSSSAEALYRGLRQCGNTRNHCKGCSDTDITDFSGFDEELNQNVSDTLYAFDTKSS